MDYFRRGLSNILVLAYLDDLIILFPTYDQHLDDLTLIFARLRQFQLRANREKCVFVCASVRYLGHLLTPTGIGVDPEKTAAIANRAAPRDLKGVQLFLQACSWYRRFIENFAEIFRPLSELTRKNVAWNWTERHQESFETLKSLLMTAPILQQADEGKPFSIRTDASSFALGGVGTGRRSRRTPCGICNRYLARARGIHDEQQHRHKEHADRRYGKVTPYAEGDQVWVTTHTQSSSTKRTTKKFDPKRDGPYVITKVISPVSYQVAAPDSIEEPLGVYHVSALHPYQGPAEQEPVVPIRKRGRPRKKGKPKKKSP
ncbi:hypothetical protein JTB14_028278 [Gonioctena quinquepunctata]|nr:hypothetical protein JTB14_028278 [Gonioctena quinquepunctata]